MELQALVADDEQLARDELCFLLERLGGVKVVGQAANGVEAIELLESLTPDVAFLDVQMPGLGGFEVARELLARNLATEIIFVTAYDQHAIEAFEVHAVDYLLKPVEAARLEQAVRRVERLRSAERTSTVTNQELERIVQLVSDRRNRRQRLVVKVGERFQLINADELIFASLADEEVKVVANRLAGTSNYRTLDELQTHLDPDVFWRVHRSHLVNINRIKEIVPWFSRNFLLKMNDTKQTEIPVSRAQTKRLRDYLKL